MFTDQTLEQEIKCLNDHGGMVGLSQDEVALDRLVTTTSHASSYREAVPYTFPSIPRFFRTP